MLKAKNQDDDNGSDHLTSNLQTQSSPVVFQLPKRKPLNAQNSSAKIIPATAKHRQTPVSVPFKTKISIFSSDGEAESFNVLDLDPKSDSTEVLLTVPVEKIGRPIVPLLSTCKDVLKRISPVPFPQDVSPKKTRQIRPRQCTKVAEKCRICAAAVGKMLHIFGPDGARSKLAKQISTLLPIKVEPIDKLPLRICTKCHTILEAAYSLYVTCKSTDLILKNQLEFEICDDARRNRYIPLVLSDSPQSSKAINVDSLNVVGEKLVSISTSIPKDQRVAQVLEAVQAGLGVEVPDLEKMHSAGEALSLLNLPLPSKPSTKFFCAQCKSNLTSSFELLQHQLFKFKCSKCRIRFCTRKLQRNHRLKTHLVKPSCKECGVTFSSRALLQMHLKQQQFMCSCCNSNFHSKESLLGHMTKQMEKIHSGQGEEKKTLGQMRNCEFCGRMFFNYQKYKQHLRLHDPEYINTLIHKCTICPRAFSSRSHLERHLDEHLGVKKYQCNECKAQFSTSGNLALHVDLHSDTKYQCDHCQSQFLHKMHLLRHIKLKHLIGTKFQCNICHESFQTRAEVSRHCLGHSPDDVMEHRNESKEKPIFQCVSPFKCPVCGGCKASSSLLKRHLDLHRKKGECRDMPNVFPNMIQCNICFKDFMTEGNLKTHVTMAHVKNQSQLIFKPPKNYYKFKCTKCPKMFKIERDLMDHESAVHLGMLLYTCDHCERKFSTNANRKVHIFGKKVQPQYKCSVCPESFPSKCQRDSHSKFHEEGALQIYKCSMCDDKFSKMAQLHGHIGKRHPHQTTKNIYCDICGKGFNIKAKFNKHFNSHFLLV